MTRIFKDEDVVQAWRGMERGEHARRKEHNILGHNGCTVS